MRGLGEGVRERRPAVADRVGQRVPPVQVAEGGVVDAVEHRRRHDRHATDADVALGVARLGARDEGVREHDRAGGTRPAGQVRPDPPHRLGQGRLVRASREPPWLAARVGVEVGDAVHGHRAVLVLQQDRRADGGGVGADEDARGVDQPGAEPQPLGRVVVAAGQHDLRPGGGEAGQRLVGEADGVDVGERAVVDVPGDHHEVHPLRGHHVEQVVHVGSLVREHALPVEGPPEVPVGGVEDAHTTNLEGGADSPAYPRRRPAQV